MKNIWRVIVATRYIGLYWPRWWSTGWLWTASIYHNGKLMGMICNAPSFEVMCVNLTGMWELRMR